MKKKFSLSIKKIDELSYEIYVFDVKSIISFYNPSESHLINNLNLVQKCIRLQEIKVNSTEGLYQFSLQRNYKQHIDNNLKHLEYFKSQLAILRDIEQEIAIELSKFNLSDMIVEKVYLIDSGDIVFLPEEIAASQVASGVAEYMD